MDYRALPWVTYTEPELASVGLNEVRAREAGTAYRLVSVDMSDNDRARAEGETGGRMKILYDGKKRVLGVQIAGPHAGEMLMPGVFAVSEGWKLGKFLGPVYPYPTVSEMYKSAAGKVLGPALFNDRVRALLRLVFRYRGEGPKEKRSHE
jgi:pyruvate/2-oxoglutarate dehydrogenase complex dihydrolipoamide dehydrogenase (E3) component